MPKKITVGLFNDSFFPMVDGVGMVVDNYARRLSKKCNVIVFVPSGKYDDTKLPYKVVRCKSIRIPFLGYSIAFPLLDNKFKKEVKNNKLDIIHIHSPFSVGKFAAKFGRKNNIPVLATMHSQYRQDFLRAVKVKWLANILNNRLMKVYDSCTQCFTVNNGMADLYYQEYHVNRRPLILGNATEMNYVSNKKDSCKRINSLWNISSNDKVFLFVGRINKLKNIFFIVDCIEILSKRDVPFTYKLLMVGDGVDFLSLKNYIHNKNLDDLIILCENVSDRDLLRDYYVRSDLFLFPSLYDASSIVQIEAASQKVPTIFLKGSKTSSDIKNRVNGFIAEDENEFVDIIIETMTNNKLYKNVQDGVYKDIYRNRDMTIEQVFKIYNEYVKNR